MQVYDSQRCNALVFLDDPKTGGFSVFHLRTIDGLFFIHYWLMNGGATPSVQPIALWYLGPAPLFFPRPDIFGHHVVMFFRSPTDPNPFGSTTPKPTVTRTGLPCCPGFVGPAPVLRI